MNVTAVHDRLRRRVAIYVDLGPHGHDGSRLYLKRSMDGQDDYVRVEPCAEPPHYFSLPERTAVAVGAALAAPTQRHRVVDLESWGDFVALVDLVAAPPAAPITANVALPTCAACGSTERVVQKGAGVYCGGCGVPLEPTMEEARRRADMFTAATD